MKNILVLLAALTLTAFAADPAELRQELEFPQRDLATFDQKLKAAQAAGVPESETLLPQLAAAWVHGDAARVHAALGKLSSPPERLPGAMGDFCPTLEEIKKLVEAAEANPKALADAMKTSRTNWLRREAVTTLEDLRLIDAAVDQWAIENNKTEGTPLGWAEVELYLKKGTRLQRTHSSVFGDAYGPRFFVNDPLPAIPAATWKALESVVTWKFFKPYPIAGEGSAGK